MEVFLFVKISSVSRHYLIGNLIEQKWHAKSNMLGRVTLQFIKAKRVLKSLVSLETKFQEKPWAPKYHVSSFWAVPLPFSAHPKGPRGTESPEVPRSARSGTAWHVPRADLSLLVTVPGTYNEYQETQTGEHQVKP